MPGAPHTDPNAERARQALERRRRALLSSGEEHNDGVARELQDIASALERISLGHWGLCQACGHAIGNQLLRSSPERSLCLSCELA
jgi:DnaK suppressor protein